YNTWKVELPSQLANSGSWWLGKDGLRNDVYWLSPEQTKFLEENPIPIVNGGLHIGFFRNNKFQISIPFLQKMSPLLFNYYVKLTEEGTKKFTLFHEVDPQELKISSGLSDEIKNATGKHEFTGVIVTLKGQAIGLCKIETSSLGQKMRADITPIVTVAKYLRSGL
ncbi:MAG: hypothetical protein ACTSW4_01940, partial [Candidatus Ranarchaeia archaeon]